MSESIKSEIIGIWDQVQRVGSGDLIQWLLDDSDFFTAPCSTRYHLAEPGGLAKHSLNVYKLLSDKCKHHNLELPKSTIIICGLGHDLCKVNYYGTETRWRKDKNGRWESYEAYCVNDHFPLGHGEKSVSILKNYIHLEPEEELAIRWHMGYSDPAVHFNYPSGYAYQAALKKHPLVTLLHTADLEAAQILEAGTVE